MTSEAMIAAGIATGICIIVQPILGKLKNGNANGKMCERMATVEAEVAGLRREVKLQFKTVFRLLGQKTDDPGSDDAP